MTAGPAHVIMWAVVSPLAKDHMVSQDVTAKTVRLQAHGLVLLSTLLVAGSFIAAAPLAQLINPYSLTLLRFLLAAVLLAPVVLLNPTLRPRVLPALPRTLIISFLFSTFFVCMFEALQTTTSLNTAAIRSEERRVGKERQPRGA